MHASNVLHAIKNRVSAVARQYYWSLRKSITLSHLRDVLKQLHIQKKADTPMEVNDVPH